MPALNTVGRGGVLVGAVSVIAPRMESIVLEG